MRSRRRIVRLRPHLHVVDVRAELRAHALRPQVPGPGVAGASGSSHELWFRCSHALDRTTGDCGSVACRAERSSASGLWPFSRRSRNRGAENLVFCVASAARLFFLAVAFGRVARTKPEKFDPPEVLEAAICE